jgi:DNA ligase 1
MDGFAEVCEEIASHSRKLEKIGILAEYLNGLSDSDYALAVQFLSIGPVGQNLTNFHLFTSDDKSRLAIGGSVLRDAIRDTVEWDQRTLRTCFAEVGDTAETAALLLARKTAGETLSLKAADAHYQELFRATTTARKRQLLAAIFRRYRPLSLKYFIKTITRGLRIGLMERMVEEAIAQACGVSGAAVRDANNRLGDLTAVAIAARKNNLASIGARLFHPMDFMLAKPIERLEDLADTSEWIIEEKFDGIRSQVHFDSGRVQIYTRGLDEVTHAFPEIAHAFAALTGNGLVDGEILAWRNGRALNFNVLQQRIACKTIRPSLLEQVPVAFVSYDLLFRDGLLMLDKPLSERRQQLEATLPNQTLPLLLSAQHGASDLSDIERLFTEAREHGNEGLMLKKKLSVYEPGRRSGSWYKLKRPFGSLDVVITSAEQGNGRRAIFFSDYTFAIRAGESFLNIGKAYSGLTDSEVKELTKLIRVNTTERFGPTAIVRPSIVLEVAFDGIQKSSRHKSGYALRFPRILRWRRDKNPGEADDLARVESLYQESLR